MTKSNRYTAIHMTRPLHVPGTPIPKDRLENVDGVAHAGGIDVDFGATIITVPWHGIKSAVRAVEVGK